MPLTFPDRFWWLQRVWGVLGVLASLAGAVWLVMAIFGLFNFDNFRISWELFIALLVIALFTLAALAPVLSAFGGGIGHLLGSSPARKRFHKRLLAIQGDQDAIAPAEIKVDAADAPRLSDGPLELLWQQTARSRLFLALIDLIFIPVFIFLSGWGVYVAYAILTTNPTQLSWLVRTGLLLLEVIFLIGAPLLILGLLIFSVPMVFIQSFGIIADADGILYHSPRIGQRRMLRWEEIRLFEVEEIEKQRPGKCTLYGQHALIQWRNQAPSKWVLMEMTSEEYEERHQALLNLIVARTHLLPRTFDEKLAEANEDLSISRRQHG